LVDQKINLQVKEDRLRGVYVHGLTEVDVSTEEDMKSLIKTAWTNKNIAATRVKEKASRSHTIC
jgi:hypothetical protein